MLQNYALCYTPRSRLFQILSFNYIVLNNVLKILKLSAKNTFEKGGKILPPLATVRAMLVQQVTWIRNKRILTTQVYRNARSIVSKSVRLILIYLFTVDIPCGQLQAQETSSQ